MKISDDVVEIMNLLDYSFADQTKFFRLSEYTPHASDMPSGSVPHIGGLPVADVVNGTGIALEAGCNCNALVIDDVVIKWNSAASVFHSGTSDSASLFYNKVARTDDAKYFAACVNHGRYVVQERVTPFLTWAEHNRGVMTNGQLFVLWKKVIELAVTYGVHDVHDGNWGFRGDDITTPVIFDYSEANVPVHHWYDLNVCPKWFDTGITGTWNWAYNTKRIKTYAEKCIKAAA